MLPAFDINKTVPFSLESDTEEPRTIFHLGMLDAKAEGYINTTFSTVEYRQTGKDADGSPKTEPVAKFDRDGKDIETVALALKSVQNFSVGLNFTDKQYPFGKRQVLDESSINALKPYITELAREIRRINSMDSEAIKN